MIFVIDFEEGVDGDFDGVGVGDDFAGSEDNSLLMFVGHGWLSSKPF